MALAVAQILAAAGALLMLLAFAIDLAIAMAAGCFLVIALRLVAPELATLFAAHMAVGMLAGIVCAALLAGMSLLFKALSVAIGVKAIDIVIGLVTYKMAGHAAGCDHVILILLMILYAAVQICAANQADFRIREIMDIGLLFFVPAGMGFATICAYAGNIIPYMFMFLFRLRVFAFSGHSDCGESKNHREEQCEQH